MDLQNEIKSVFNTNNFKKSFWVTFFCVLIGFLLLFLFIIIIRLIPKDSSFSYLLQNGGLIFLFISLLLAYSGVHRLNTFTNTYTKDILKDILRRSHYILAISFAIILFLIVVTSMEIGISFIGKIPYIGPGVILLLTIPFFIVNFLSLLIALCIIIITPNMIGEGQSFAEIIINFSELIKRKWLNVFIYITISLVYLIISLILIYYLVGYSVGVTKVLQWKISAAYPKLLNVVSADSLLTDFADKIIPGPDPINAFKRYGFKIFDLMVIVRYTIGFFYFVVFSLIISFPLALYFNISSIFYKWIKE